MLIEGYEIYLESISLLLVAFVFLFLVLLSLLEWSGNKTMAHDRVEHDVQDESEGNNGSQDDSIVGSNYNNKAPASESQLLIDRYIGKVDFNMKSEDLDKPWFHKQVTRQMAQDILKGKEQGTFIVRPSSQRGSYAMSWVKNAESGEISHSLIHGLFPGFSLKQTPTLEERFWSLQSLVDNCPHLQRPVVSSDYIAVNNTTFQRTVARTSSEVIGRIVEKLYANNPALTEIKWNICILGEGTELYNTSPLEKRTFVRYCDEEYAAPELLPLNGNALDLVCQALQKNTTLRSLTITGHEGYMRMSFKPNIGDTEAAMIAKMLQVNKTLTQLNLNINEISDAGAKAIAQGLTFNRTLRGLNLSNNFLTADGLGHFAELLKTNPALEYLDVKNQLHKNRVNSVALSCGDSTKQLIALIDDTMRRRAELVASVSSSASSGGAGSTPARSTFLSVFHGFLSKKKVERRLASHVPGSFLFYLNRYIPNVVFIGIVQDAPSHTHSAVGVGTNNRKVIVHKRVQRARQGYILSQDAPQFQHELEAITKEGQPVPKQTVPSLFEYCAWYISSHKELFEYAEELEDEVLSRLRAVQLLVGLWGVKFLPPPAPPASPSGSSSSSSSSSRSHKSSHGSRHHSSHSHHSKANGNNKEHYSTSSALNKSPTIPTSPTVPASPTQTPDYTLSTLSLSAGALSGTDSDSATDSDSNSHSKTSNALSTSSPALTIDTHLQSSVASPATTTTPTPHSPSPNHTNHTSNHHNSPNNNNNHHNNPNNNNNNHHNSPNNNNNHHNHTNHHNTHTHPSSTAHHNHTQHAHTAPTHTTSSHPLVLRHPGPAMPHTQNNVFSTITYLVHKNKSWLKYPVQIPQDPQ